MSVSFLERNGAENLAYRLQKGKNPGLPTVVFLGGFRSDMEGTKAAFLAEACERSGQTYLRFDYRGHGASGGAFEDGTIGLWFRDALDVIDSLTSGDIVLAGSSMGGWIGLLVTLARGKRIKGFIGLAAAPDFTREITAQMNDAQRAEMAAQGYFLLQNDYADPYKITKALLEDGENHCLLDGDIDIACPVRLIQGMKDTDVPWQTAHRISNALKTSDKKVYLREEGDHRLSTPDDLALLESLVAELTISA